MKEVIGLGGVLFKRYGKEYKSIVISMAIGVFAVLFFSAVKNGIGTYFQSELSGNIKYRAISSYDIDIDSPFLNKENLEKIYNNKSIEGMTLYSHTYGDINICINNRIMAFDTGIVCVGRGLDCFSRVKMKEAEIENPAIAGRCLQPDDYNCAMIDEQTCFQLGIVNAEEAMGTVVSIVDSNQKVITEAYVVGVYDEKMSGNAMINATADNQYLYLASEYVFFSDDILQKIQPYEERCLYEASVLTVDIEETKNVYEMLCDEYGDIFIYSKEAVGRANDFINIIGTVFSVAGIILILISFMNLFSAAFLSMEIRAEWFSLQKVLGFSEGRIVLGYITEIACVIVSGSLKGTIAAALFCLLTSAMVNTTYETDKTILCCPSFAEVTICFAVMISFFAVCFAFVTRKIREIDEIEVLKCT